MKRDSDHFSPDLKAHGHRWKPQSAAALFTIALFAATVVEAQPKGASTPTAAERAEDQMRGGLRALTYAARTNGTEIDTESAEALCQAAAAKTEGDSASKVDACLSAAAGSVSPDWQYERIAPRGMPVGVAGIGVVVKTTPAGLTITDVVPGSPAQGAGLGRGNTIVAVGDSRMDGASSNDGVLLMRGASGTPVQITVICAGTAEERRMTLVRREIRQEPFYATSLRDGWYVQIRDYGGTLSDLLGIAPRLRLLLLELAKVAGSGTTVIDLRGNSGGLAAPIVDTAAVFLPAGMPVMYTASAVETEQTPESYESSQADKPVRRGPLVVLVDQRTGNGSEWLAETLQRYGGALVVGEPTAGGVKVRRGLEPFKGARFMFPVGELFGSGGSALQGTGVQPDVLLDKSRLSATTLGKPPAWLQGWLDSEMPAAVRARADRALPRPLAWRGPAANDAAGRALCVGSAVAPIGADFPARSRRQSTLKIETTTFSGRIDSRQSDEPAFDEAAATVEANKTRVRGLIEMAVGEERKASAARASGFKQESRWTRELIDWRKRLPLIVNSPIGNTGARLYRYENGYSEVLWRAAETNHSIQLDLGADVSNDRVVAAYADVVARLQSRPDDAAPPATAGVCIANAFLGVASAIHEIEWQGEWQLPGQTGAKVEWRGHFSTEGGRAAVDGRQKAEMWMLEPVRNCASMQAPAVKNEPIGGLMGVTRTSALADDGGCRVLRSISRLPHADAPGFDYAAGVVLSGMAPDQVSTAEAAWRLALRQLAVLDTPAAPPGNRPSRVAAPAEESILSAPAPPRPLATR